MAAFVFNIAKGRVVELYNRVKGNDPANSAFIVVLLAASGLESDAVLKDKDDLAALVAGTTNEATNTGYSRKTITDAALAALPAPDDSNDRYEVDMPDQTWTAVANDGTGALGKAVICFDYDTTAGTDANIIPCVAIDFAVTPDGSNVILEINASGFFRGQD